ncbi:MAG: hypothetical protein KGS61_21550, partial [Verrucomicrobia bacterium]|nr:hypothetical protein [Verrucomicrobiota bacterium]
RRATEAEELLRTIDTRGLTGPVAAVHALARFEAGLALHRYEEARRESEQVDPHYLFPVQRDQFERERRQLPAPPDHRRPG